MIGETVNFQENIFLSSALNSSGIRLSTGQKVIEISCHVSFFRLVLSRMTVSHCFQQQTNPHYQILYFHRYSLLFPVQPHICLPIQVGQIMNIYTQLKNSIFITFRTAGATETSFLWQTWLTNTRCWIWPSYFKFVQNSHILYILNGHLSCSSQRFR